MNKYKKIASKSRLFACSKTIVRREIAIKAAHKLFCENHFDITFKHFSILLNREMGWVNPHLKNMNNGEDDVNIKSFKEGIIKHLYQKCLEEENKKY